MALLAIATSGFWEKEELAIYTGNGSISGFLEKEEVTIYTGNGSTSGNISLPVDYQMDDGDSQSSLQNFLGALPLISVMLAAIGYQLGLSPIAWSYSGK